MNTATLDLPVIDEALIDAAPRTDVAVAAAAELDLQKIDLTAVALAQFGQWRPAVAKLKADNAVLVLDLSKQTQIDEAKSLRERTINKPMADARKVSKALKSKLTETSKSVGEELEALVLAYDDAGKPLTELIDAAQKVIDDKKAADREAEETRLSGLRATIDQTMQKWLDRASEEGITAERIGAGMAMLTDLAMPAELADVAAHWTTAKAATVAAMLQLQLAKLLADKAERDREDADIDKLNELANDCVARGAQYIDDCIGELDNVLAPTLSTAPRVHAAGVAARARMVALLKAAQQAEEAAKNSTELAPTGEGKAVTPGAGNAEAAPINGPAAGDADPLDGVDPQCGHVPTTDAPRKGWQIAGAEVASGQVHPTTEEQHPKQVLKAEPATADATDRGTAADTSPGVGPMGAGQPADAGPAWAFCAKCNNPDRCEERGCQDKAASEPAPMLQDQCRALTDALASKPDAMRNAREAAAAITPGAVAMTSEMAQRTVEASPMHAFAATDLGSLETSEADAIEPPAGRVILMEPEPEDDTLALLEMSLDLVKHARAAFNGTRWPTQPKPDPSWWDALKQAAEALEPRLLAAIEAREPKAA